MHVAFLWRTVREKGLHLGGLQVQWRVLLFGRPQQPGKLFFSHKGTKLEMQGTKDRQFANLISSQVVNAAIRIHRALGPGLLENVYETVLARDLVRLGLNVERQKRISFEFETLRFNNACRVDLVLDNLVMVEIKSVDKLIPLFEKQLLTYLRVSGCPLGLILNFGAELMKDGLKRFVI